MNDDDIARSMGRGAWKAGKFMGKASWMASKFMGKKALDILTNRKEQLAKEEAQRRREEKDKYRQQIGPQNGHYSYSQIEIAEPDKYQLGLNGMDFKFNNPFMFRMDNKIIFIPESSYGYNRGYYLVQINFTPDKYDDTNGAGYSHSEGSGTFKAKSRFNMANTDDFESGIMKMRGNMRGNMRNSSSSISRSRSITEHRERLTYAIFTFFDVSNHSVFSVRVNKVNSKVIDLYRQYFLLSQIEQKQLGLI